jgi:hypothetical protein
MKKLLIILVILISLKGGATDRYISTAGSNANAGTIGAPWLTLKYACDNTTSGDIIHVTAGTYTETVQSVLAPGVSIEGDDSATCIIKSTVGGALSATFVPLINATSASLQTAPAHISNLKFDGQLTGSMLIWIAYRDSFTIHNCTIINFFNIGIVYSSTNDFWTTAAPATYRAGNKFYNNIIKNCANYDGWGRGALCIGGQVGFEIYNNVMTQEGRATGANGWPIKYWNDGYLRGLKIYNNTITKNLRIAGEDWFFCMEIFNGQGTEIYGNTIQGSLDFNFQGDKGTYPYVLNVHDNTLSIPSVRSEVHEGIIMEYSVDGMIIKDNIFNNLSHTIAFFPRIDAIIKDVYIQKNLVSNLGSTGTSPIFIFGFDADNITTTNFNILNNTVSCDTTPNYNADFMMNFQGGGTYIYDSLIIKNNLFKGFSNNVAYLGDITKFTNCVWTYNDLNGKDEFGNENNTVWTPSWSPGFTGYPGTITISNNLAGVEPLFIGPGNYTLQSSSPLIDAGVNVGLPFNGSAPDIGYAEYGSGGNASPSANAGNDQTITLPTSSVTLTGSGTDADGTIASYAWTKISGPAGSTITSSSSATTTVTGLVQGVYVFRLTVTDNLGATGFGDVQITVNAAGNIAPKKRYIIYRYKKR